MVLKGSFSIWRFLSSLQPTEFHYLLYPKTHTRTHTHIHPLFKRKHENFQIFTLTAAIEVPEVEYSLLYLSPKPDKLD